MQLTIRRHGGEAIGCVFAHDGTISLGEFRKLIIANLDEDVVPGVWKFYTRDFPISIKQESLPGFSLDWLKAQGGTESIVITTTAPCATPTPLLSKQGKRPASPVMATGSGKKVKKKKSGERESDSIEINGTVFALRWLSGWGRELTVKTLQLYFSGLCDVADILTTLNTESYKTHQGTVVAKDSYSSVGRLLFKNGVWPKSAKFKRVESQAKDGTWGTWEEAEKMPPIIKEMPSVEELGSESEDDEENDKEEDEQGVREGEGEGSAFRG